MRDEPDDDHEGDHEFAAPDHLVLRASTTRWVWVLIGSMVFVTIGGGMAFGVTTGVVAHAFGACTAVLFGFCAIVAIRQILNPGSLVISRDAIQMIRRGHVTIFGVKDCGRFTTWRNPSRGTVSVVFDYAPDGDTELNRTNRRLMGGSRSISDNYGLTPEALAHLLNEVRDAATAGGVDGPTPQS